MLDVIPIDTDIPIENVCRSCREPICSGRYYIQVNLNELPHFLLVDVNHRCPKCGTEGMGVMLFSTLQDAVDFAEEIVNPKQPRVERMLRLSDPLGRPQAIKILSDRTWFPA